MQTKHVLMNFVIVELRDNKRTKGRRVIKIVNLKKPKIFPIAKPYFLLKKYPKYTSSFQDAFLRKQSLYFSPAAHRQR